MEKFNTNSANPDRAQPGWPPVVVAGAYQTGIVLMRNLGRRGLRVSAIEPNPGMPGFRTVYGKVRLCPNPDSNSLAWIDFMVGLSGEITGAGELKPVLIPSSDQFVSAIGEHAAGLAPYFTFCLSSAATQALLATKERQYEVAEQNGLPVPNTRFVRNFEELRTFALEARFPCLLKPIHCREWERLPSNHPLYCQKVGVAETRHELEDQYRLASDASPELVVQEIITGPDSNKLVYLSCYAVTGRRLGSCVVRQLRTMPIRFGSASVVEPVIDPEADSLCDRFLTAVGYSGICEIELKRDDRDGAVRMIEANPRYSVTADAAPYAGIDIGWLHYLDLIGVPVFPVEPSRAPFRHIVLERDFGCFRSYLREGLVSWGDLFRSYRAPVAFFDFDFRDWRVTAVTVEKLARLLAGPLWRRFFPKAPAASEK